MFCPQIAANIRHTAEVAVSNTLSTRASGCKISNYFQTRVVPPSHKIARYMQAFGTRFT
ncbi:MAG: hypothetical protein FWC10_10950 [Lentimicrobiaceae bacterium]|nr:hypothetical protein [Lentimicrobiaceae bacterium]